MDNVLVMISTTMDNALLPALLLPTSMEKHASPAPQEPFGTDQNASLNLPPLLILTQLLLTVPSLSAAPREPTGMLNNSDVFLALSVVPVALTATPAVLAALDSFWELDLLFAKKSVVMD